MLVTWYFKNYIWKSSNWAVLEHCLLFTEVVIANFEIVFKKMLCLSASNNSW